MARQAVPIVLNGANLRNNHFYLRDCRDLLPADAIGGKNKAEPGRQVTIRFEPGQIVETDIAGDKMIFRCRAAIRQFFELTAAEPGDVVILEREGERAFTVRLEDRAAVSVARA